MSTEPQAHIKALELDSIYFYEVVMPAIEFFQQRDIEQKATIAAQKTRIVNLEAAYDLRGRHLDAAQDRIATLENAIVVSGATLRAIRDEIEGGNDE